MSITQGPHLCSDLEARDLTLQPDNLLRDRHPCVQNNHCSCQRTVPVAVSDAQEKDAVLTKQIQQSMLTGMIRRHCVTNGKGKRSMVGED